MNRIDAFTIFAKVGKLESISGAARALHLPKANVSRAVARLERDYGVALVERTTRSVVLTEIGRRLHEHCERLIANMTAVDDEIAAYRGEPSGILRVGCPPYVSRYITPHLPRFLADHPDVDVRMKVADRVLPDPHGFDIVLHVGWLADSALIARKIHEVPMILVASPDYVARHDPIVVPDDLAGHPVIGLYYVDVGSSEQAELPATVHPMELVRNGQRFPLPQWRRFSTNDQSAIMQMAEQGVVIAPTARILVCKQLEEGRLVHVLPDFTLGPPPALYAVYASRMSVPPKVRAFSSFVAGIIPSLLVDQTVS